MTYVDIIEGQSVICKAYSQDGIHWRLNGDGKPLSEGKLQPLGMDPHIGRYVLYPRVTGPPTGAGRSRSDAVGRSTSADFITWSDPEEYWRQSLPIGIGIQGFGSISLCGRLSGMLWVFEGNKSAQAELAFSRDGVGWQRMTPDDMFLPQGARKLGQQWNSGGRACGSWRSYLFLLCGMERALHRRQSRQTIGRDFAPPNAALRHVREGWIEKESEAVGDWSGDPSS